MRQARIGSSRAGPVRSGSLPTVQCRVRVLGVALGPVPPELIPVALSDVHELADVQHLAAAAGVGAAEAVPTEGENEQDSAGHNEALVAERFPAMPISGRQRRKPKSALQTLIEVVVRGVAGCLVAYYGLAFYYGPGFRNTGLPQLPLPGISWITAPRPADGANDRPKDKPRDEKPAKNKPRNR